MASSDTDNAAATAATVIGSTGLTGSFILETLLSTETFRPVCTISRRAPASSSPALQATVEADTSAWAARLTSQSPAPAVVFSALGTTRAAAGGLDAQWKIDHDLNVELAGAAKAAGASTFVFVSSGGVRSAVGGRFPYSRMKAGVEDAVRDLDFDHGIVLRPGMILGQREESRAAEGIMQSFFRGLGSINRGLGDALGHEAQVIGRAAVRAAQLAEEGKAPSKFWVLEGKDIVRLGRDEWPGAQKTEDDKPASQ